MQDKRDRQLEERKMTRSKRHSDLHTLPILCSIPSFPTLAALAVLIFSPSFGSAFSLPSKTEVPIDPCLEVARRCETREESGATVDATMKIHCPNYHPSVFDGRVCLGCFRDDYEISNWDGLSFAEKAYALEDASERAKVTGESKESTHGVGGSIPAEELKRHASVWMALAAEESKPNNESGLGVKDIDIDDQSDNLTDMPKLNQHLDTDPIVPTSKKREVTIPIQSTVTVSTNERSFATATTPRKAETIGELKTEGGAFKIETPNTRLPMQQMEEQKQHQQEQTQSPPPPTPCTRICRYNASCYDGKVCIGCFRDTHDIAQWSSMSPAEKMFSLEDAADRCRDLSETGKDTDTCFEGGISEAALRDQATLWGAWKG